MTCRSRRSTWPARSTRSSKRQKAVADKLHVDIVTVEGRRYRGDADFVVAPGSEGELGVLPRHVPLLTPLAAGTVKVRNDGEELFFFVGGGFLEGRPDQVTVLADAAERPADIDEARAEEGRQRARGLRADRGGSPAQKRAAHRGRLDHDSPAGGHGRSDPLAGSAAAPD